MSKLIEAMNKLIKNSDERKQCNSCWETKRLACFDLMRNVCKECRKEYRREYYLNHRPVRKSNHRPGVTFVKSLNKWKAYQKISNGHYKHIGYYSTEQDAIIALKNENKKLV